MQENKIKFITVAIGVLISVVILITSINQYSFDNNYYNEEFEKNSITEATGMEKVELDKVTKKITSYLSGKDEKLNLVVKLNKKSIVMFNDKEIAHMVDVKKIFSVLRAIRSLFIILVLLFVILMLKNEKNKLYFSKALIYNGLFTTIVFFALVVMVYLDFTKYFIKFHELFFTNDLWILDPKTDRLIQMLPENFFSDIAVNIAKLYAGVSFALGIIGANFARKYKA